MTTTTINEMAELKNHCTELFSVIQDLKQRLNKVQSEYYNCRQRYEQLDRQQAEAQVKRLPYAGPRRKPSLATGQCNAFELIAQMTPQQQAELLAALKGA